MVCTERLGSRCKHYLMAKTSQTLPQSLPPSSLRRARQLIQEGGLEGGRAPRGTYFFCQGVIWQTEPSRWLRSAEEEVPGQDAGMWGVGGGGGGASNL